MAVQFHVITELDARAILNWRYDLPYDFYNADPDEVEEGVRGFLEPQNAYYSITDPQGDLVAFCCFGPDARVPGGEYEAGALDIGLGVRPDLTGRGRGHEYVSAVLDFARWEFAPAAFRVTVAGFNKRALRVWQKAGFQRVQVLSRENDGRPFVVMLREG